MKKVIAAAVAAASLSVAAHSQMLEEAGVKNTLWTGMGKPLSKSFCYDGVIDVLQARIDAGIFTIDAMINWGLYASWDYDEHELDSFAVGNTSRSPFSYHYTDGGKNKGYGTSNIHRTTEMEKYYVNFVAHPFKGLDAGFGTKLNWGMGPAPSYGEGDDVQVWDAKAHVRQGGLATAYKQSGEVANDWDDYGFGSDAGWDHDDYRFCPNATGNRPGTTDVAGFVPYANRYAMKALALRYRYNDFLEIGAAAPSGMNTDHPLANIGVMIHPADILTLNAVYEGIGQNYGNLYTGGTVDILDFLVLDVYMAIDGINFKSHHRYDYWNDPMAYSVGAGLRINITDAMSLRPEGAINWFENDDYSAAFYLGMKFDWEITEQFIFGAWGSYALGSEGDGPEWDSDWGHGFVVDVRPDLTYKLNDRHSFGANIDFEWRHSFDDVARFCWSTGVFWTYNFKSGAAS